MKTHTHTHITTVSRKSHPIYDSPLPLLSVSSPLENYKCIRRNHAKYERESQTLFFFFFNLPVISNFIYPESPNNRISLFFFLHIHSKGDLDHTAICFIHVFEFIKRVVYKIDVESDYYFFFSPFFCTLLFHFYFFQILHPPSVSLQLMG